MTQPNIEGQLDLEGYPMPLPSKTELQGYQPKVPHKVENDLEAYHSPSPRTFEPDIEAYQSNPPTKKNDFTIEVNEESSSDSKVSETKFEEDQELKENENDRLTRWQKFKIRYPYWRIVLDVIVGAFFTAWWLSIIIQDKKRHKWLIPTILYIFILLRLITWHWKIHYTLFKLVARTWNYVTNIVYTRILPTRLLRYITGATITVGVILLGTFVPKEVEFSKREDRAISFTGLVVTIICLYLTSSARSQIQWNTVIGGVLMQFIVALFVLRTKCGYDIFNFISFLATKVLGFAKDGVAFLTDDDVSKLGMFVFTVLPAVMFFIAFIHIFEYLGVVIWFIDKFARVFFWTLRITGAEAVAASASPFLSISESAVLVKDFLPFFTRAEMHQIMTSGFSTISGAVLVGYIGLGLNAQALVSSCIMSIPASIAVSKMRRPETENPLSRGNLTIPKTDESKKPTNILQAFSSGATLGLFAAATMLVQCLCIIALVALINALLTWFGGFWNIKNLTLDLIFGYVFYPATFLLGVPRNEILMISRLISTKFMQNEYVAYSMLTNDAPYNNMSSRGKLIATYALCGFANFGSVGITLGILNTLTKGKQSAMISREVWSSLFSGFIATMMSAAVAGMVINDIHGY